MSSVRRHYAGVIAALALFIALGGGAYAAIELPAGSVHAQQIAPGSVSIAKLAFALGSSSTQTPERSSLPVPRTTSCPPGASCPAPVAEPAEIASQELTLAHPGNVLVLATAGFTLSAPQSQTGAVQLEGTIDGQRIGSDVGVITGTNGNTVPLQGLLTNVRAGRHRVALIATSLNGDTATLVANVSLIAVALPPE